MVGKLLKVESLASLTVAAVVSLVGSAAVATPYSDAVLALNPVSYWQLNDNTLDSGTTNPQSGTWVAGSGTSALVTTGVYSAGPRPSDGFLGMSSTNKAGDFNGGDSAGRWVRIGSGSESQYNFLNSTSGSFSFVAWIKTTGSNIEQSILTKTSTAGTYTGNFLGVFPGAGLGLIGQRAGTGGQSLFHLNQPSQYASGTWSMIVLTSTGGGGAGGGMQLYINGVAVGGTYGSAAFGGSFAPNGPLAIGGRAFTTSRAFNGQIDESAVFSRALTSQEVSNLYQAALVPEPSTLALVGLGAIGVATYVRRRSRRECQR